MNELIGSLICFLRREHKWKLKKPPYDWDSQNLFCSHPDYGDQHSCETAIWRCERCGKEGTMDKEIALVFIKMKEVCDEQQKQTAKSGA